MIFAAVCHTPDYPDVFSDDISRLSIRLRCKRDDIESCSLVYFDKYRDWNKKRVMKRYASGRYHDFFQINIEYKPYIRYINYYFELIDKDGERYYFSDNGFAREKPLKAFFEVSYLHQSNLNESPDWVKDSIFYQIFVDRFCDGDNEINPVNTNKWGSVPNTTDYMGGDLKGIIEKIEYLKGLGVNALYLTPVFKAQSYHKYDTLDYYQVDPAFGRINDLKSLVDECHSSGIRVVLDGVFNHVSYYFEPFQDALKRGRESEYYKWFYFNENDLLNNEEKYQTTGYYELMPKLNLSNPEVKKYIFDIASFWMEETSIDGWRLDVADEIDRDFLRDFRRLVKGINKEAFIIGEIWYDGRRMLKGDQVDSVMNYIFRQQMIDFFAKDKIEVKEFVEQIEEMRVKYPEFIEKNLLNLLDSHDTERFLTSCNNNIQKLKLAAAFQMTFTGIPMIFYGDEIGLQGANDPDCRQGMSWEEDIHNTELPAWYRKLIKVRKENRELRVGDLHIRYIDSGQNAFIFERSYQSERIFVFINNSASKWVLNFDINVDDNLIDLLTGKKYFLKSKMLKSEIDAYNILILKETRGEGND